MSRSAHPGTGGAQLGRFAVTVELFDCQVMPALVTPVTWNRISSTWDEPELR
jgi:hypothetical protein